jgi:hypoxanthine phosphoribosyltransferase
MENSIKQILLTEEEIQNRIRELGEILTEEYAGKNPIVVGVLKGVVVFYADMIRHIKVPCEMDFMCISSYSGTDSTGKMTVNMDLRSDIKDRHVLILEDIFDTGSSLDYTVKQLLTRQPASLKVCTLLDKPERRRPDVTLKADYVGFTIPNAFVVGYGLDYNEHYRNLPYVGILKPEVYEK